MIFWNLIFWAVTFVATALLAPKPKIENARPSTLGDISFPRASEGFPVNYVRGRVKVSSPNTLWYGDFATKAIKKKVKTGLFSSKHQTIGYKYFLTFDLSICLGPDVTLHSISMEKDVIWSGTVSTQSTFYVDQQNLFGGSSGGGGVAGNIEFFPGSLTQTHSSYLDSSIGEATPAYLGVCHAVFMGFYIGNSTQLRAVSFEVSCYTDSLGLGAHAQIGDDINPMELLYDAMITGFGGMLVDPSLIDTASFLACGETLFTEENGCSVVVDGSTSFKEFAIEVLRQIDGIVYQDPETSLITARLIRNDFDLIDLPVLDQDDFTGVSNISKSMWSETFNQIRLVYKSRIRDYTDTAAYAEDMANISFQGRPKSSSVSFPLVKDDTLANYLAFRELSKLSSPILSMSLTANRRAANLKPGDPFRLSLPKYGITDMVMRVQRFSSGGILDNRVKIEAYQDNFSVSSAVFAGDVQPGDPRPRTEPIEVASLTMIELPWFLTGNQEEVLLPYSIHNDTGPTSTQKSELIMLFPLSPSTASSSFEITFNYSETEFGANAFSDFTRSSFEDNAEYPTTATLVGAIAAIDGFITGEITFTIEDLYGELQTQTLADARHGSNLIFFGDEILLCTTVVDNLDFTYTITAKRAVLDTAAGAHSIGDRAFFISSLDTMIPDLFEVGDWAKSKPLAIFNVSDQLDISAQSEFKKQVVRRRDLPIPPDYLMIDGVREVDLYVSVGETLTVSWRIRNRNSSTISIIDDATEAENVGEEFIVDLVQSNVSYGLTVFAGNTTSGSFTVPVVSLGPAELRIRSRSTVDSSISYSAETMPVIVISGFLVLSPGGVDKELLSGDMTDGNDALILSE